MGVQYAEAGSGEALVLLHGGLDDSRSWRWQLDGLAAEFRVLAWDAPGCGRSAEPPEKWRLPDYADCAAAWLDEIDVSAAHVLGLSWGSALALELYRRHPGRIRSLILASAYAGWAGSLPPDEVSVRLERALAAADVEPASEDFLTAAASPQVAAELAAIWASNTGRFHAAGFRAMVRSMAEADLRDVLPTVAVPTLLLYGELDERAPRRVAVALHAGIPTARLVFIPGVGHISNAEAPDAFNTHVRDFLESVTRP